MKESQKMKIEKIDLEILLGLLEKSKELHEGGYYEAHDYAKKACDLLTEMIDSFDDSIPRTGDVAKR
jgi:hypothetical protein